MALENEEVIIWEDRGLTGTLNIPNASAEFIEKEEYSLVITISNDLGKSATYTYKVENALEHIPSLCVEGNYSILGTDGLCYGVVNTSFSHALYPYVRLRNITSNVTITLVDSSGDTDVFTTLIDTPYGADCVEIQDDAVHRDDDASLGINIEADFPLFMGERDTYTDATIEAVTYQYDAAIQGVIMSEVTIAGEYENINEAVNSFDEADTIPRDNRYYINNIVRKNGSIVEQKRYEFRIGPTSKIGLVANIPHEPEGLTSNMILKITSPVFVYREGGTGDDWTVAHVVLSPFKDYYRGEWTDYSNGDFYKATTDTNIPIWKSNHEWGAYVDGELTEDDAENAGDLSHKHPTTGDDLDSSDIESPQIGASGVGANVWALSKSDLEDIVDILYDDDQSLMDDIKEGIWLWGNNPMDFIISLYYVPFDVSDFYSVSSGNSVYFGSYNSGLDKPKVVENKASNRIVLCNTPIESVYGDYRDITQFKYELFLPYIGFIPLNINAFLDKMLKVEMAFDVMTHNIRYYIYANGIIQERVDGSVGYDIPLMGTDQVNKAKSDIQGVKDIIDTTGKLSGSFAEPKPRDIITSVNGCISAYQNLASKPTAKILGGISSCMNIYDIKYVYLKITETGTIKPGNLNAIYNYPSYYIGNSAALSGYCELQDIQLSCAATDEEIAEIKSLLKGGVIF